MKTIVDNRNVARKDVWLCSIGDLYKPWYYVKWANGGVKEPTKSICLVYDITEEEMIPTKDILTTSFQLDPRGEHLSHYYSKNLERDLAAVGQKEAIVCLKHYNKDSGAKITFRDGAQIDSLRCYEGHHRLVTLEKMNKDVRAITYKLYDIDEPMDISKHYNSIYDDSFWSTFQTKDNRKPWFPLQSFEKPQVTPKYQVLIKCFDFIKSLNKTFKKGIDIGCSEGAYTQLASKILDIPMTGIDSEPGRIIRGLLSQIGKTHSIKYQVLNWTSDKAYETYNENDFLMALSITHHIENLEEFLQKALRTKQVAIIEARLRNQYTKINKGSIIGIHSREFFMDILQKIGMQYKHIQTIHGDRNFFVLWR